MAKFTTRARAVDMLGRQQIAGIPSAISELFKNAHDAYADHVEVDYFRSDGLFILRDDGLGMTGKEFEERWLTLGTESKLGGKKGIAPPPEDLDKKPRPITGEKGIGRLAIAIIGPQVLVLTRAQREGKFHDLVAAFIHWGLFECPGINLDQIEIPIRTFPGGTLPNREEIAEMVNEMHDHLLVLKEQIDEEVVARIAGDLNRFMVDPAGMCDFLNDPKLSLTGEHTGTHFYILPVNEKLSTDLETDLQDKKEISDLKKLLLGFSNTMVPNAPRPPISTAFRYWRNDDVPIEMIGEGEFFTPEEFQMADHHIQGQFDEYGQFRGTITVYNGKPIEHTIPWTKAAGKPVLCGPFRINVTYVHGNARESRLSPEEYAKLSVKLDRISGLYIYRDGIRVLPYGDSRFDFLRMEERRSKSASYYFFTYRRIFGAIEITREQNEKLIEKAGREGFQENKAYGQFKDILINFFIQIAADFFRESGDLAKIFLQQKAELDRLERARREGEKKRTAKRRSFAAELDTFFERVKDNAPQKGITELITVLENKLRSILNQNYPTPEEKAILDAEMAAKRELDKLRNTYKIQRPKDVGLTKQLQRDWNACTLEYEHLEKDIFLPTEQRIQDIVKQSLQDANIVPNQRRHLAAQLQEVITSAQKAAQQESKETKKALADLETRIVELTELAIGEVKSTANVIVAEFNRINFTTVSQEEGETLRRTMEQRMSEVVEQYRGLLEHVRTQLTQIDWSKDREGHLIGDADITAALEEEVLALRERVDVETELANLGRAIEIINHEFGNSIKTIRANLQRLKAWADTNPALQNLYNNIRTTFDHLDGYLTLFTPLHRRLYRKDIEISGADIAKYLQDLFGERMKRHQTTLISSNAFKDKTVTGYPSTFYPVFINLMDNAIFWLKDRPLPREIRLDADQNAFIVSDTGPGISVRDREAVFELGFSRKPGGTGQGLFIAREELKKEGFVLELDSPEPDRGATFRIYPKKA